ncbi:streptolysin S family bacteriocin [Streptomyces anulatus]|uniref:streptolysin S family bacteriocin n=1 Tax=Streptomyces anulatus TaxID=1892 RepID=UPI00366906C9
MPDYRISNLTVRIEQEALPGGVALKGRAFAGHPEVLGSDDSSGGPGCGCTCSCSCSCTCSCSSSSGHAMPEDLHMRDIELTLLRESVGAAITAVEEIEHQERTRGAASPGGGSR